MHSTFSCNFVLAAFTGVAACIEADLTAEESYELEARVSTLDIWNQSETASYRGIFVNEWIFVTLY
jgi:hypothetical protein